MIYFDENKHAYAFEIPNYIATVNDAIWASYAATDKWDIIDGEFVDITDTEEYKEKQAQKEREQKTKDFFYTSLGYVRRKVTMATGEIRDFLFDIKPTLQIGIPIITYNEDGTQNRGVLVTEEFLKECDKQIYFDFYGSYPEV